MTTTNADILIIGGGLPQLPDDERITRGEIPFQRQRPRGSLHFVAGVDVVLYEKGKPMKGTANPASRSFCVQFRRDALRIWIKFDDRIDLRVKIMNSFQKRHSDLKRTQLACEHFLLEFRDGVFHVSPFRRKKFCGSASIASQCCYGKELKPPLHPHILHPDPALSKLQRALTST